MQQGGARREAMEERGAGLITAQPEQGGIESKGKKKNSFLPFSFSTSSFLSIQGVISVFLRFGWLVGSSNKGGGEAGGLCQATS